MGGLDARTATPQRATDGATVTSERPVHVPKRMIQLAVPVGVVLIIVMLVVPLPAVLLDLLLAANISISVLILLTAMFVNKPPSSCSRCSGSPSTSARPGSS